MSFAYLHECFPDPTKTFVYREVAQMVKMGMEPVIFSVREPSAEEKALMGAHDFQVRYLPEETELRALIERERDSFSRGQRRELSHWRAQKGDSNRVFEALWLGRELRRLGVRHVHAHFAGLAARTAWLVRRLWGIGYSFTGHADDIFSPEEKPISLAMLVHDARFIAACHRAFPRLVRSGFVEQRGEGHAQTRSELLQHDRRRAALAALDERNHRTAHAAPSCQPVQRDAARGAKFTDVRSDSLI